MEVFSNEWQESTAPHPAFYILLTQGLMPFQFLFDLGGNLGTLAECLRVKQVVQDLRVPDTYESSLLEMRVAAQESRRPFLARLIFGDIR
jgi:hypothetical protein